MTQTEERKFYVYEHWRPDKDEPFYVGKGRGIRANNMSRRNPHHRAIQVRLARLGMRVVVRLVVEGLDEAQAFAAERILIAFWRGKGLKLANRTDGGEGTSGLVPSPEWRAKQSAARKGIPWNKPEGFRGPWKGKTRSPEARAKMSAAAKRRSATVLSEEARRKISESKRGKKRSPETNAKISAALKGRIITAEMRSRISAVHKGKVTSPETRAKMAASAKAHHARQKTDRAGAAA